MPLVPPPPECIIHYTVEHQSFELVRRSVNSCTSAPHVKTAQRMVQQFKNRFPTQTKNALLLSCLLQIKNIELRALASIPLI